MKKNLKNKKSLSIAMLGHKRIPSREGGIEIVVEELATRMVTGFVQGQLLDELYGNAYIYSLPSDLEGMPLSLLEAMSYGNCCLVSDIDECASVVEDKAIVFKKSDVADLQSKLQKACDDVKQVQKYKDEAADYICEKYNWDDVVKRTLKKILQSGLHDDLRFFISSWVNIDEEFLDLAKQCNIKIISFGIESGNKEILRFYRKNINIDEVPSIIRYANSLGIQENFGI